MSNNYICLLSPFREQGVLFFTVNKNSNISIWLTQTTVLEIRCSLQRPLKKMIFLKCSLKQAFSNGSSHFFTIFEFNTNYSFQINNTFLMQHSSVYPILKTYFYDAQQSHFFTQLIFYCRISQLFDFENKTIINEFNISYQNMLLFDIFPIVLS